MPIVIKYNKDTLPTAQDVTNIYLYGQKDKPNDLLDPSTWPVNDPTFDGKIVIEVDNETFINQIARFFDASSFDLIKIFMGLDATYSDYWESNASHPAFRTYEQCRSAREAGSQAIQNAMSNGVLLTKQDLAEIYGLEFYGITLNHAEYDADHPDYIERTYIWASQAFKIGDDTRFIIHPDGTREIQNFSIDFYGDENFDFAGGQDSNIGNPALEPVIDPSDIGHKVDFKFVGASPSVPQITEQSFQSLYENNKYSANKLNWPTLTVEMQKLVDDLFHNGDRPIAFLDDNNRPIIYSKSSGGKIEGTKTSHIVDGELVDISKDRFYINILWGIHLGFDQENNLAEYVKNGITYIGGKGDDQIYGTDKDDHFHGGSGTNILSGGLGKDSYCIGQGGFDHIFDINEGKYKQGQVFVGNNKNQKLTGGTCIDDESNSGNDITYYSEDGLYQ